MISFLFLLLTAWPVATTYSAPLLEGKKELQGSGHAAKNAVPLTVLAQNQNGEFPFFFVYNTIE